MSHQDHGSVFKVTTNCQSLRQAIEWLILPCLFGESKFREDCSWKPHTLAAAAWFRAHESEEDHPSTNRSPARS